MALTGSGQWAYTVDPEYTKFTDVATRGHTLTLPLDYTKPDGKKLEVFGYEVVDKSKVRSKLPWMLYLQGGPGFQSPRPTSSYSPAWMRRALEEYRVLFLDQRGMGQSSMVTFETIDGQFGSAAELADYLTHFRADNIVRDAEEFRKVVAEGALWTLYGQSFGGFCIFTYLSFAPGGVQAALVTGGIPPALRTADEVYQASLRTAQIKTERAYRRYPELQGWVRDIVDHLHDKEVTVPGSGTRITPEWFQTIGFRLLETDFVDELYSLCKLAFITNGRGERVLSYAFRKGFEGQHMFDTNPLYAVLHEAIYADGSANAGPTAWAAHRMTRANDAFRVDKGSSAPVMLTGEMIFPHYFDNVAQLAPFKEAAEILAHKSDWGALYDFEKLARNEVPVAAAVYYEDAAVSMLYSMETARAVKNTRVWITNEYEHNANKLGDGYKILDRLIAMTRGDCYFSY